MNPFDSVISNFVATWGYLAVFAATALEGFGLFFIPGETTLIAAAIVAGATHQLNIAVVLACGFAGGVVGDNFSYWVGHQFGFGLIRRHGHVVRLNERRVKFIQYLYLRYGSPIVFVGRFIMLLRAWESFLAGANGMPWRKFFRVNAAAILVWVCVWGMGAYALGQAGKTLLEAVALGIFVAFCIIFAVGWIYFRRHEDALEQQADEALPGPLRAHRPSDVRPEAKSKPLGHPEHP